MEDEKSRLLRIINKTKEILISEDFELLYYKLFPNMIHIDFSYLYEPKRLVNWLRMDPNYAEKYSDVELQTLSVAIFSYLRNTKMGKDLTIISNDSNIHWIHPDYGEYKHNSWLWYYQGYFNLKKYINFDEEYKNFMGGKHGPNYIKGYKRLKDIWINSKFSQFLTYNRFFDMLKENKVIEKRKGNIDGYYLTKEYQKWGMNTKPKVLTGRERKKKRGKTSFTTILIKEKKIKSFLNLCHQFYKEYSKKIIKPNMEEYCSLYELLTDYWEMKVTGLSKINRYYLNSFVDMNILKKGERSYYFTEMGLKLNIGINCGPDSTKKALFNKQWEYEDTLETLLAKIQVKYYKEHPKEKAKLFE